MMILVFFTNVSGERDMAKVSPALNAMLSSDHWSIDLGDCDKVLRVESNTYISSSIVNVFRTSGFECREMATTELEYAEG